MSKADVRNLENAQALADANQQIADAFEAQTERRDDVLNRETRGAVRQMGLGALPGETSANAARFVTLYHAFDDRTLRVPMYMAPQRITERFPSDTEVPEEWHRKQVWYLQDMRPEDAAYAFQCRLSRNQADPAIVAEMSKAGLAATCRKRLRHGGFGTQFEADEHFRVKHPRRWQSYQRFLGVDTAKTNGATMQELVQAVVKMVEIQSTSRMPAAAD